MNYQRATIVLPLFLLAQTTQLSSQWLQKVSPTDQYVTEAAFYNSSVGWISTGTDSRLDSTFIWKTLDSGTSWVLQNGSKGSCHAISVLDSLTVLYSASGGEGIWRTTDSGSTWVLVHDSAFHCFDIDFPTPSVGFAVGGETSGIVKKTTDAGQTWLTSANVSSGSAFSATSFTDALNGFALTFFPGTLFRTTDGGFFWEFVDSIGYADQGYAALPMRDTQFVTRDSGWTAGGISGSSLIARTTDGGANWQYTRFPYPSATFQALHMLDPLNGWVAGYSGPSAILRTTDGGSAWHAQTTIPVAANGFKSVFMVDTLVGYAVGQNSIYATTNGGIVTSVISSPTAPVYFTLDQNYPNPFNNITQVTFSLSSPEAVQLEVMDILGRTVAILQSGLLQSGPHRYSFDASQLPGGIYLCRLRTRVSSQSVKMILLK